jgi:sortase (surface protein transpeptidase)
MATRGAARPFAALALLLTMALPASQSTAQGNHEAGTASPMRGSAVDSFKSTRTHEPFPAPVRLRVPTARIDSPLQRLGRNADGTIAVPDGPTIAGWYEEGPRPGQPGPAVILGHVDSAEGPGVFFHLAALTPGVDVYVDAADGRTVSFRVIEVSRVPKTGFPTDLVYSPTLQSSLRLVTCGGSFDHDTRQYSDNVIVYALPA